MYIVRKINRFCCRFESFRCVLYAKLFDVDYKFRSICMYCTYIWNIDWCLHMKIGFENLNCFTDLLLILSIVCWWMCERKCPCTAYTCNRFECIEKEKFNYYRRVNICYNFQYYVTRKQNRQYKSSVAKEAHLKGYKFRMESYVYR